MHPLYAVLPGNVDDPAAPSGGNLYDRKVLDLLAADRDVQEILVDGTWPSPDTAARDALAAALHDLPDHADVLVDGLVGCGVPEILEPHAHRVRLIVLVHLPLSDETGLSAAHAMFLRERERRTLLAADTVIATSRAAAHRLADLHDGVHGVAVVEPGVDPAPLASPQPGGERLLCVASVTPRKGQDLLVRVLEDDLADLDWSCTFVGALAHPVPYHHPKIHFVGPRTGVALAQAYGQADLFVLPSRAETYGMVVTEALARGLPVIATAVGGLPEALGTAPDGSLPGVLLPKDDRAALAEALRSWLTDAAMRDRLRARARARRERLPAWSDTARRLGAVLDARGDHA
ncbi:glycosyltransferase family 4 protein [Actinoplanes sp. TBRC 11911]|nr:glycosyltransferase family 4 protein [Actinoplanes sp. TBRC 11911]